MEWTFEYNIVSELEVGIVVKYKENVILEINTISESTEYDMVDFYNMDMDEVEDYLIENYLEYIETEIAYLKRLGY